MNRADVFRIDSFTRHVSGALDVVGRLTRTGVLKYADGNREWSEFRSDGEVFNPDSLETLRGVPFVVGHPGKITPENWSALAKGHVRDDVRKDGKWLVATIRVSDAATIKAIEGKKLTELSCGYTAEICDGAGEAEGEKFDASQKNIKYNHVGVGAGGWARAGKEAKLLMDSGIAMHYDAEMTQLGDISPTAQPSMTCGCGDAARITNGKCVMCKLPTGPAGTTIPEPAHAISMDMPQRMPYNSMDTNLTMPSMQTSPTPKLQETGGSTDEKAKPKKRATLKKDNMTDPVKQEKMKVEADRVTIRVDADKLVSAELETVKAERDVLKSRCDSLEADLKKAQDQSRFDGAVNQRVDLLVKAKGILGAEFKTDGVNDLDLQKAVIAKCDPKLNCDGKSADYVRAMFDMVSSRAAASVTDQQTIDTVLRGDGAPKVKEDEARAKHAESTQNAWKGN